MGIWRMRRKPTRQIAQASVPGLSSIPPVLVPGQPQHLTFSFKYLDLANPKFHPKRAPNVGSYVDKLLVRLRDINKMAWVEFAASRSGALRTHRIDWVGTSEPEGFRHLNEQLRGEEAWQFQVSANKHGRVHGFVLRNVFHVVWFDPNHQLYPGK